MAREGSKPERSGAYMKFTAPKAPIFSETKKGPMEPLAKLKKELEIKTLRRMAKDIGTTNPPGVTPQEKKSRIKSMYTRMAQLEQQDVEQKVDSMFVNDFILWLQGKSYYNSYDPQLAARNPRSKDAALAEKTPWGKKKLVGDSIDVYLKSFATSKIDLNKKMAKMRAVIPNDIWDAWLYYKYLVRDVEPNPEDLFLPEMNYWTSQPPMTTDGTIPDKGDQQDKYPAEPMPGFPKGQSPDPNLDVNPFELVNFGGIGQTNNDRAEERENVTAQNDVNNNPPMEEGGAQPPPPPPPPPEGGAAVAETLRQLNVTMQQMQAFMEAGGRY